MNKDIGQEKEAHYIGGCIAHMKETTCRREANNIRAVGVNHVDQCHTGLLNAAEEEARKNGKEFK